MKLKAPTSGKRPDIKPPKFVTDLYRDLRDQRLLPIVIVLLIAIPVVPILLGDKTPAFVAPPPEQGLAAVVADDALMVVAAPAGLRRHGERFAEREPRDPFVDPNAPAAPASSSGAAGAGASLPSGDSGGSGGDGGATGAGSGAGSGDDGGAIRIPPAPPVTGGGRGEQTPPADGDDGLYLFRQKTTVVFGKAGSGLLHTFPDIERMRGLPKKQPIAVFVGPSEDGKRAVFSISADAARVTGAGSCSSGRPIDCQFLTLRKGKAANIHDARRGVIWRLAVRSIEMVETEVEASKRGGKAGPKAGADDGTGVVSEPVAPDVVKATSLSEVIGLYLLK